MEFLFLSWDDIQRLSEIVSDKIINDDYNPEIIVAVSRGGFDPARIISDQLGIRKLASVQVAYYTGVNTKSEKPEVIHPLNADVSGSNILVVDDVADSGDSLLVVKEYIGSLKPKKLKIATLHYKPWSILEPDYYAAKVEEWIIYPWEPRETINNLLDELKKEGLSFNDFKRRLKEIGFSEEQISRYLPSYESSNT
jgi:hypothetical protein